MVSIQCKRVAVRMCFSEMSAGATFSLPAMAMVTENETSVEMCITMATMPAGGMLGMEVDLTISTMSGTGKTDYKMATFMTLDCNLVYSI